MKYMLKLGATISFNKENERDIIAQLESLKKRHKLGEFISNTIRIAFEHPELLEEQGTSLEKFGLTDNRQQFFDAITKEVNALKTKVDKIYKIATEIYTLTQFNKKIGLEERAKNILCAQFILQKQTRELCNILGVSQISSTYASEKLFDINKNVDETLEFIINYYDGIVGEIRSNVSGMDEQERKLLELKKSLKELEDSKYVKSAIESSGSNDSSKETSKVETKQEEQKEEATEEITEDSEIDGFDLAEDADLAGMADFLGIM